MRVAFAILFALTISSFTSIQNAFGQEVLDREHTLEERLEATQKAIVIKGMTAAQKGPVKFSPNENVKDISEFFPGFTEAPFERAMVLNGIGLDFGVHLGMIDAAETMGKKPDVIIGTCGGGIPAALHRAIPSGTERLALLLHPAFYTQFSGAWRADHCRKQYANGDVSAENPGYCKEIMGSPDFHKDSGNKITSLTQMKWYMRSFLNQKGIQNKAINYFGQYAVDLDQGDRKLVPDQFEGPVAPNEENPTRYVIIAGKTNLTPEDFEKGKKAPRLRGKDEEDKHYTEVLFTDEDTAQYLQNFRSPLGVYFPNSSVKIGTEVVSGKTFGEVIRPSVSDPFVYKPAFMDDAYWVTGGIDLNPIEVAKGLGKEVTFLFRNGWSNVFNTIFDGGVFGYNARSRQKFVSGNDADYWVDVTDRPRWYRIGFDIKTGIPMTYKAYAQHILRQYVLGYIRTAESYCLQPNEKRHLRNVTKKKELSKKLMKEIKQARKKNGPVRCDEIPQLRADLENLLEGMLVELAQGVYQPQLKFMGEKLVPNEAIRAEIFGINKENRISVKLPPMDLINSAYDKGAKSIEISGEDWEVGINKTH